MCAQRSRPGTHLRACVRVRVQVFVPSEKETVATDNPFFYTAPFTIMRIVATLTIGARARRCHSAASLALTVGVQAGSCTCS